jgi:2-oxo-4-hydroxy-4-carboxy-5-ureidoimidazoline decarboxylase
VQIDRFDRAPRVEAEAVLRPCCASSRWIAGVVERRPYGSLERLIEASDEALARLDWSDVEQALAAHPRIGDRVGGADREAQWSRQEQAGAAAEPAVAAELVAGNLAYEARFGHVFLICATGRSAPDMLAALRARLDNPEDVERGVVRTELREIVRLRLIKSFH